MLIFSPLSTSAQHGRSQRVKIPDAVKYNFDLLKMSIVLLGTCRGI
jgi:virulence-associated protein VagC